MADSLLNEFVARGTTAERTAFTPTPPTPASGPDPGYTFFDTDDGILYSWDGAAWAAPAGTGTVTNTGTLTDHAIIVGNGGVDVSALGSLGTTTTVLHGNAAGDPTFAAVSLTADVTGVLPGTSGGGRVLLEQHTASGSATLDFTSAISSTYDTYAIEIVNVMPASNTVNFLMRVGTGAGPSWDSGSNYTYAALQIDSSSGSGGRSSPGTTSFEFGNSQDNTSTTSISGFVMVYGPQNGAQHPEIVYHITGVAGGASLARYGGGRYLSTTVLTGFQFLFSSGNIASGTIRVYGMAK